MKKHMQGLHDSFVCGSCVMSVQVLVSPFNHIFNMPAHIGRTLSYCFELVRNGGLASALKAVSKDSSLEYLLAAMFGVAKPRVQVAWKASTVPFINICIQW